LLRADLATPHETFFLDLPLCRLKMLRAGQGPALVMVPATISRLENWHDLVAFAAQWFEVYFFELPGHGESTCLARPFTTALVGELVEQMADALGLQRFSLMGFSFGGILAMQAFLRLHPRIDRLVLISPCLTGRAIQLSAMRRAVVTNLAAFLKRPAVRNAVFPLLHDDPFNPMSASLLRRVGHVEDTIPMDAVLKKISPVTLEVLAAQIDESLKIEFPPPPERFTTPCYFAMSVNDPLIEYRTTFDTLQRFFAKPSVTELDFPFHQPPRPFTYSEFNTYFRTTVEDFLTAPWDGIRQSATPELLASLMPASSQ
jgi:pimeloyl-ACP methyl ester carboxylesterase